MALGLSAARANATNDAFDGEWIQLHVGDPGANGTANVATETTRQQLSLLPSVDGVAVSDADLVWLDAAADEDATHWSSHSLAAGGVFGGSGLITADAIQDGNTFTIPAASFVLTAGNVAA